MGRQRFAGRGLLVERHGAVARLVLDRPTDRNRVTDSMAAALVEACEEIEDGDAAAVELCGRGAWFCGGMARGTNPLTLQRHCDPVAAVARITKPVVAVLAGPAAGLGAELALAADIRLARAGVSLRFRDDNAGPMPCFGATQRLPRLVGRTRALELLLLDEPITAAAAAEWGLLSGVFPARRLPAAVRDLRNALARRAPLALALAKEAVMRATEMPLAEGIRMEQDLYVLLQTTEDRAEGVRGFVEKRTPRFRGR